MNVCVKMDPLENTNVPTGNRHTYTN
jgi:hypothetical protein